MFSRQRSEALGVIRCVGVVLCVCLAAGCGWLWSLPPLPDSGRADSSSADTSPADGALSDGKADGRSDTMDPRHDGSSDATSIVFGFRFDDGASSCGEWVGEDGKTCRVEDGGFVATGSGPYEFVLNRAVAVDLAAGTLQLDLQLSAIGNCSGEVVLFDEQNRTRLKLGLASYGSDHHYWVEGWIEGDGGMDAGLQSWNPSWGADSDLHTLRLEFSNGTYRLFDNGVAVQGGWSGPPQLQASGLRFSGSQGVPGTRFDNITLGP